MQLSDIAVIIGLGYVGLPGPGGFPIGAESYRTGFDEEIVLASRPTLPY